MTQNNLTAALARAETFMTTRTFETLLAQWVSIPSESQSPQGVPHLQRYLDDAIKPRLHKMGFTCTDHPNPDPNAGPLMVARRVEGADLPTVLSYGHGDVVHGQAGQWQDDLDPFVLTQVGDRLYGRGAADNKVQHLINILALEAVLEARGALGFNMTFLFEMGEEIGSPGLKAFCAQNRDLLAADVFIASDGPRVQADVPTLFMGARGGIAFELSVTKREGGHHSGNWGGLLADPAIVLSHALASITDKRGQIEIEAWRPDSLTDDVREALAVLPMETGGEPRVDLDWGEETLTPAERVYGWNSFAVLALDCGQPNAPQNAINGTARAICQLRFVVGTDMDRILPALRDHLDALGFVDVEVTPLDKGIFPATRLPMDNPWVGLIGDALHEVTGVAPNLLPNLAGSLPNDCFADVLGLPTIWVPHSYRGCNQHAPNEHVLLPLCDQALQGMTGVWWAVGTGLGGRG